MITKLSGGVARATFLRLGLIAAAAIFGAPQVTVADAASTTPTAQFGGQSVTRLAQGRHTQTDCSTTWTDKDSKLYCFSDDADKKAFLDDPDANLRKARDFIAASTIEPTEKAMQYFDGNDAMSVAARYIKAGSSDGVFNYVDPSDGTQLKLVFDGIDFARTIDGYGFFPDVKFHEKGNEAKRYLLDFWVTPQQGQLDVQEVRIYKEPVKAGNSWNLIARTPIPWWWIPASEHPGKMATKRSWEVMSAVEQGALQASVKNHGIFELKDDKTGKVLQLEFVDTHQPIRQLDDDGHYFACTDFRVVGTKDQIYDIDFWVNDKDGKMSVDQTRVHKVPELKGGQWTQVSRYEWKDLGNSQVVP